MQIRPADAYSALSLLTSATQRKPTAALADSASSTGQTASSADQASISQAARSRLAAEADDAAGGGKAVFDTDQGSQSLDIDAYFTPPAGGYLTLLPPLLLPSQRNIDALSSHISSAFPKFLAENGIPSAPASITYDSAGKMQLPADYPYAEKLKQALEGNPAMERELRTVNALASHMVEINKSIPFQQEYAAASSQAEVDAVVAKYAHLFSGNRISSAIALEFSASGRLTVTADGKAIS